MAHYTNLLSCWTLQFSSLFPKNFHVSLSNKYQRTNCITVYWIPNFKLHIDIIIRIHKMKNIHSIRFYKHSYTYMYSPWADAKHAEIHLFAFGISNISRNQFALDKWTEHVFITFFSVSHYTHYCYCNMKPFGKMIRFSSFNSFSCNTHE